SGSRIRIAEPLCVGDGFQLGVQASVEEHEEAEAGGFDGDAMTGPGVRSLAGRVVEPVAGVGESLAEGFQIGVAGVGVAVEAEIIWSLRTRDESPKPSESSEHRPSPYDHAALPAALRRSRW